MEEHPDIPVVEMDTVRGLRTKEQVLRIVRPEYLGAPSAQHVDVIKHAVEFIQNRGEIGDILVVILANNITIKSEWIDDCVKMMQDDMSISAVVPVYEDNDHHL